MSVHPGFGGQSFLPDTPKRIKQVDQLIKSNLSSISIEVDGELMIRILFLLLQRDAIYLWQDECFK